MSRGYHTRCVPKKRENFMLINISTERTDGLKFNRAKVKLTKTYHSRDLFAHLVCLDLRDIQWKILISALLQIFMG